MCVGGWECGAPPIQTEQKRSETSLLNSAVFLFVQRTDVSQRTRGLEGLLGLGDINERDSRGRREGGASGELW